MGAASSWLKCGYIYNNVTISSPDCTLHTAVTHVIYSIGTAESDANSDGV